MRDFCGNPDLTPSSAEFVPLPGEHVWPKRQFTYAFDPERESKDLSASAAHAAVQRAFNSWEEGGAELAFTEVSMDDDPDITIQWVQGDHSGPGDEHDTLLDNRDQNGNSIPPRPVAHAPGPPPLDDVDFTPRYICFDDEETKWIIAADADNDDTADDVPEGQSDLEEVAVHEIGHFLGLDHSTKAGAVMQQGVRTQRSLGADDIDGIQALYLPQGRARFNALWTKDDFPRKALQQIDGADLKALLEDEEVDGWRPGRITSYQAPGEPRRYNVVLDQTGQNRPWSFGKSREDFEERHSELTDDGFELLSVDSGADGQGWSGVWRPDENSLSWLKYVDEDPEGAPERLERAVRNVTGGVRPMSVDAYVDDDGLFFANVIMWRNPTPSRVHFGRTWDEFIELLDDLESDWSPTAVGAYVLPDGSDRWNLVVQESDFPWRVRAGYGGYDIRNEITHLEARGFEAYDLNAYLLAEPASTASLTADVVSQAAPPDGLGSETLGVAVDASRVYATRYLRENASPHDSDRDGVLVVADRDTLDLIHAGVTVGHQPRHVAVNPATGRIYVVNWGKRSYSLTAIDGTTFEVLATIDLHQGPLQVGVNPATNRVYVTNWFQGRVHVIDGDSHQPLAPIELGKGPVGIDVDPSRNQVYVTVSNRSVAPFRNGVYRINDHADSSGYGIEPFVDIVPIGAQSQDVAVDPVHDRVYVGNLGGGSVHPSLSVLHRSGLDLLATVNLTGSARAIAVNVNAREVYAATDRGVEIVDGATNTHVRVVKDHPSWNIAAAPGSARQLFLAERNANLTRLA